MADSQPCNFSIGAAGLMLYYNFNPAQVFMGDAGSIPLGFLTATWDYGAGSQHYGPPGFSACIFTIHNGCKRNL